MGGVLAVADALRRASQALSGADIERLIASGLLQPELLRAGLVQELPKFGALDFAALGRGIAQAPWLASRLAPHLVRMMMSLVLFRAHPQMPDRHRLERWSTRVRRLFGESAGVR
jgi:hypothetical protein